MEQDPITGWDEMTKIPKEREDEHITNDLDQQAEMVDPPTRRGRQTKKHPVDTTRGTAQYRRSVSAP
jgi:hypothetical protein